MSGPEQAVGHRPDDIDDSVDQDPLHDRVCKATEGKGIACSTGPFRRHCRRMRGGHMRLWGFAGIAAAAWLLAGISASPARAADDPALPPLSGPPMDVPMHEPKPPSDIEGPAPRPPSPPTTTALPIPPPQRQLSPSASAAASPAP